MAKTLRETIRDITHKHLDNGGFLFGQCLTAVGFVNGTTPDLPGHPNIIEFSISDVSNMGIACGAAISGKRPIIVIRFQDFMWLNSSPLVNYAAKSKDIWGTPVPIFVRSLAKENSGCVHSGVLHSLFMHVPGIKVCSPMTPNEYTEIWNNFMQGDDPMYVSEHRSSFNNSEELNHSFTEKNADITLFPISAARFNVQKAKQILEEQDIRVNIIHICWLKPLLELNVMLDAMKASKAGLVIDAGFETCGAAQSIAYELMCRSGKKVVALGIEDRSVGESEKSQNPTPSAEKIAEVAKKIYKNSMESI